MTNLEQKSKNYELTLILYYQLLFIRQQILLQVESNV